MNKFIGLLLQFFFIIGSSINNINCVNINAIWPYNDSIPFPYPTKDPINVRLFQSRPILTPPLRAINNLRQTSTMTNTGSTLLITANEIGLTNLTGGVLFNDVYTFMQTVFFWDDSLSDNAANRINGKGAPLAIVPTYYNTKYGSYDNAKRKRDGIAQFIIYVNVGPIDNLLYYPIQSKIQQVSKAGSSVKYLEVLSYYWYHFSPSFTHNYYAYPGQYQEPSTGKVFYSSTVILFEQTPQPSISFRQFKATFGSLRNQNGKKYSRTVKPYARHGRPVVVTTGYFLQVV